MLQTLGFQVVEIVEQLAHFLVTDEVGCLASGEHGDMSAWIGAIRAITPHLGQIEHFAHHAESAIGVRRLVGHFLHPRSHVRSLHILFFYTTKQIGRAPWREREWKYA